MHHHEHQITVENQKKTFLVVIFTLLAMVVEIAYGYITNSMALLADGFHMGTHVLALSLTYSAYILMQYFMDSPRFPKGTNKIGTLTAYTSALFLGFTGVWIIVEAFERFLNPLLIRFDEAILIAVIGLIVNIGCILIMDSGCSCLHKDEHEHSEDYNFKAAYYHILADALTSVLAIVALFVGKFFNALYLDSFVGILGGVLIVHWAIKLLRHTIVELIDMKKA